MKTSKEAQNTAHEIPKPGRSPWLLAVLTALVLSGCAGPVIHVAEKMEAAGSARETQSGIAQLRAYVDRLQAAGDPLGDYYYALGNSDGWIKDVSDPKAITALFEKAAAKGSMDARILLALQVATGAQVPGKLDDGKGPNRDLKEWERGLSMLLPLLREQCSVRRLILDDGLARTSYYSVAYYVWPEFRDGKHRQNAHEQWVLQVAKDPARQKVWEDIDRTCPLPKFDWIPPTPSKG